MSSNTEPAAPDVSSRGGETRSGSQLTNPTHYTRLSPEPISVIESWGLGFHLGNALKYIARAGHKPGVDASEDLAKALWYVQRALSRCDEPVTIESVIQSLEDQVEHERAEAQRWEIVARAQRRRLDELEKELTGGES